MDKKAVGIWTAVLAMMLAACAQEAPEQEMSLQESSPAMEAGAGGESVAGESAQRFATAEDMLAQVQAMSAYYSSEAAGEAAIPKPENCILPEAVATEDLAVTEDETIGGYLVSFPSADGNYQIEVMLASTWMEEEDGTLTESLMPIGVQFVPAEGQ